MDCNLGLSYYLIDLCCYPLHIWDITHQRIWSDARSGYRTLTLYCYVGQSSPYRGDRKENA